MDGMVCYSMILDLNNQGAGFSCALSDLVIEPWYRWMAAGR